MLCLWVCGFVGVVLVVGGGWEEDNAVSVGRGFLNGVVEGAARDWPRSLRLVFGLVPGWSARLCIYFMESVLSVGVERARQ